MKKKPIKQSRAEAEKELPPPATACSCRSGILSCVTKVG